MPKLSLVFSLTALFTMYAAPALACPHDGGGFMQWHDANGDGKVTLAEMQAAAKKHFEELDANKDGSVDQAELDAMHAKHHGEGGCPHCGAGKQPGECPHCAHGKGACGPDDKDCPYKKGPGPRGKPKG